MVTEETVEKCLKYLQDTSDEYAHKKARVDAVEYKLKITEASEFLNVESGTQEFKKSTARNSDAYREVVKEYQEAVEEYTYLQSMRRTAEMKVSWAQTSLRGRMQGTVL